MTAGALVFAVMAALMHVLIYVFESAWWTRPTIWQKFGIATQEQAERTRSLAFNQGSTTCSWPSAPASAWS